ncbi:MAG: hypothetical protein KC931_24955, partial [Candidatus Omnitrophica bacterium]|nr:hypothetical protein [Candidatus Omnitrophota bacterium]
YALGDIPPEEGGYGLVNRMFPLTPVEIHEGFVIGKERILTSLSGEYPWPSAEEPTVSVFDLFGREIKDPSVEWNRERGVVTLREKDWTFFAVIE